MKTHLSGQEMGLLTNMIREASSIGGITLMKHTNRPANLGKTAEFVMAECLVAAYRMTVSGGVDDEGG